VNPSRLFILRPVATALLTAAVLLAGGGEARLESHRAGGGVEPDSTVETRRVVVKRTQGSDSVIASGLKPGETVVIDGLPRLQQGTKIEVKTAARAPAGGRPQ
jgi:hypothetical protein